MESRKLHICLKVTKMGSAIYKGHRIDYKGVGALRGQRHIPSKILLEDPPPPRNNVLLTSVNKGLVNGDLPAIFGELSPDI